MSAKKVYTALEIGERDIRLIVYEAFDNRYLILRSETEPVEGIENFEITDEKAVVQAIQKAVERAENALGFRIERVLLAIPSVQVERVSQTIQIGIEDGTRNVRLFHIQQGIEKAREYEPDPSLIFVNINRIRYDLNGRTSSKMPLGEEVDSFSMEIDFLFANRKTVFSYVKAVERAGLEVLDIFLGVYAQAQETAALAHSWDQTIIMVSMEPRHTVLTLLSQGRILSSAVLDQGFETFIKPLQNKHHLSREIADRLLDNLFSEEQENQDSIIYIEQQGEHRVEITADELAKSVLPNIRSWIAEINAVCEPIISNAKVRFILTGQGSGLPIFKELAPAFAAPVQIYKQSTAGARNGAFSTGLGMGYAWEELNKIYNIETISVNRNELEASIESIAAKKEEGKSFTLKLKRAMMAADK